MADAPAGFPAHIEISQENYENWSLTIKARQLWIAVPKDASEVAEVCNWAKAQTPPWPVRPTGIRHGWSPLTIDEDTPARADLILLDTTVHLVSLAFMPAHDGAPPMVKAGAGATMFDLLTFLQNQPGGDGAGPGFAFPHVPAPGNLTVGGVLAIDAHGTAVPSEAEDFPSSYGSLSNRIMAFEAVVSSQSEPYDYVVQTFERGDPDAAALLTHAGRAFLTSATLEVIPNYNLQCTSTMDITSDTLFAEPRGSAPPANSIAAFLQQSGRVEAIWYPFTNDPWLKVWTNAPQPPAGSRVVNTPYNYAFSDHLPTVVTRLLKRVTTDKPQWTPDFSKAFAWFTKAMLGLCNLENLWGPSMNTLLYIQDETLRVTANGYAIQMNQVDVQQAVHDFAVQFETLLKQYADRGQYPVNSPLEIRITGLDDPALVYAAPGTTPQTPLISALTCDAAAKANGWNCAVWFDVLTLPGTPYSNDFYSELEAWFRGRFVMPQARLLPEWSKGWAYTADQGGWSDPTFFAEMRTAFTVDRDTASDWNAVVATLKKYDRSNLYANTLLDTLFVPA